MAKRKRMADEFPIEDAAGAAYDSLVREGYDPYQAALALSMRAAAALVELRGYAVAAEALRFQAGKLQEQADKPRTTADDVAEVEAIMKRRKH